MPPSASDWPDVHSLPSLVDSALSAVRLFMYPIPAELRNSIDFELNATLPDGRPDARATGSRQRIKHPWMNLEHLFWSHLPKSVWTTDPEDATFFVIPHAVLAHRSAWDTTSSAKQHVTKGIVPFLDSIYYATPYFNRSRGRDHLIVWGAENGLNCDCVLRQAMVNQPLAWRILQSVIKVGYWGHRDEFMYGWRPDHDISVPQWGAVDFNVVHSAATPLSWRQVVSSKKWTFGFAGSFWGEARVCKAVNGNENGTGLRLEAHTCGCSPGVRVWLQGHMQAHCYNRTSQASTMLCTSEQGANDMGSQWFALCPSAHACWSSRLFHAIDRLVIPVIMADGHLQPFESLFDWRRFSVALDTAGLRNGTLEALDLEGVLHREATDTRLHCAACPTCDNCTRIGLVRRVRQLEKVRHWFRYSEKTPYSVSGLFLVELHCRQLWRAADLGTAEGQQTSSPCVRTKPEGAPGMVAGRRLERSGRVSHAPIGSVARAPTPSASTLAIVQWTHTLQMKPMLLAARQQIRAHQPAAEHHVVLVSCGSQSNNCSALLTAARPLKDNVTCLSSFELARELPAFEGVSTVFKGNAPKSRRAKEVDYTVSSKWWCWNSCDGPYVLWYARTGHKLKHVRFFWFLEWDVVWTGNIVTILDAYSGPMDFSRDPAVEFANPTSALRNASIAQYVHSFFNASTPDRRVALPSQPDLLCANPEFANLRWAHRLKRDSGVLPNELIYHCVTNIFRLSHWLLKRVVAFSRVRQHAMFCEMRAPSVCAANRRCRMRSFFDQAHVHLLHTASAMATRLPSTKGREENAMRRKGVDVKIDRAREAWVNTYVHNVDSPLAADAKLAELSLNYSRPMLYHAYKWKLATSLGPDKLAFDAETQGFGAVLKQQRREGSRGH